MTTTTSSTPWFLWPFTALWRFLTFVLCAVGRIVCFVLGLGLMAAGTALSLTYVGAIVGIPLAAVGLLLMIRAVF